jgi:predicted N-acetyltransferase YhbS
VIVRPHRSEDYEAVRYIYTEAFRRPENPDSVPPEVPLFEALWEAGDALPEFSFTAQTESGAVGHVTASKATRRHRLSCCRRTDRRPSGTSRHGHQRPDGRASHRC